MKIGLFVDEKKICYNTLNYFVSNIERVLDQCGVETEKITKLDSTVLHKQFDALIGCNRPEPALHDNGRFILDALALPFFNIIVDPPYYHHDSLKVHAQQLHLIFMDNGQVEYCKKYYPDCKSVEMGYLVGPIGNPIPYENRRIDILFTGGCADFNAIKEEFLSDKHSGKIRDIFMYIIENGIKYPEKSTDEVVLSYLQNEKLQLSVDEFNVVMNRVGTWAEYYLRGYYRDRILRILVESGLHITIAGAGWEKVFPQKPDNLTLIGRVDMLETAQLTADARILLNVMPWFKHGLHDRIPTAMHNEAVCVTDSSSYIDEHFRDGEDIVLYRLNELDQLPDKCRYLLNHPKEAMDIAQAGKRKADLEYTWERFVYDHIVKWLL